MSGPTEIALGKEVEGALCDTWGEWRVDTAKDEPSAFVDVYHIAVSCR